MNFNCLIFLSLIIPSSIFSQDYLDYYSGINRGRVLASENKIEESILSYYSTFEQFDFVFARDCYNATEISAHAKDTIKLDCFIRRGLKQGILLTHFLKTNSIRTYENTVFFKKIASDEDSLHKFYTNSIIWEVRERIIEMFELDQSLRKSYYASHFLKRKKIGILWENLIGLDTKEMHPKIHDMNLTAGMPIILFIHHYNQPNQSLHKELLAQLRTGNIHNEHFATISDFEAKFGRNRFNNFGYLAFKQRPKNIDIKTINSKRREIGLLSLEEFQKLNQLKIITRFWNRLY